MNIGQLWRMFLGLFVKLEPSPKPIERLSISQIVIYEWPCEICKKPIVNRDVVVVSELFDDKDKYVGRNEYVHANCAVLIRKQNGMIVRPNGQVVPTGPDGGILEKVHSRTILLNEIEWINANANQNGVINEKETNTI